MILVLSRASRPNSEEGLYVKTQEFWSKKILNSTLNNKVNLAFLWFEIKKGVFWSKNLFFRSPGWKFCKNFLLCTSCQIIHFILFTIHLVWKKHVFTFSMRWLHDNFLYFSGLCHLSPISISSQHKLKIGKPKIQISMTCARTMVSSGAHCTTLRCKRQICSQCKIFLKDLFGCHTKVDGAEFWISFHWLKLLRKASCW